MCGRARCSLRPKDYPRACHLNNARPVRHLNMDRYRPSYNVGPGFNVPVVRSDDGGDSNGVVLHCMKWGLIPSFTKKTEKIDHFRMFNARSESIREKASFRRLIPKNRCLVSFEGFYEWKKDGSRKQPYHVYFKDGRPMVFAALYDSWKISEGEVLYTFTIITTSSSSSLEWLHDRMPVILGDKESVDWWLNDSTLSNLDKVLKPYEEKDLVSACDLLKYLFFPRDTNEDLKDHNFLWQAWYPVTNAMGKLSFDGPECIKKIQVNAAESNTKPISSFFSKKSEGAPEEPKHDKIPKKDETVEASEAKSVKEETESQPTFLPNTGTKVESIENRQQQKSTKEESDSQDEHLQFITKEDDSNKRDYAKFSSKKKTSPVRKKK